MTRRIPILPTMIVLLAVATMVWLGFWQLGRAHERDAIAAGMIARARLPQIEYPYAAPADEALLYRHVRATCSKVAGWTTRGGESRNGDKGWRQIARCLAPGGTRPFGVDIGIAVTPDPPPSWRGGEVTGITVRAPDPRGPWQRLTEGKALRPLMVIADRPAPGLKASKQPDPRDETNSSWSYAGQWFLFALTALVIYAAALRKRWRSSAFEQRSGSAD